MLLGGMSIPKNIALVRPQSGREADFVLVPKEKNIALVRPQSGPGGRFCSSAEENILKASVRPQSGRGDVLS